MLQRNILRDSLHPTLKRLGLPKGGFNIFRRFRLTHLDQSEVRDALKHFWSGHAAKHVSERYIKLRTNRQYRLDEAERIGLGFELPESVRASIGPLGPLQLVPKVA